MEYPILGKVIRMTLAVSGIGIAEIGEVIRKKRKEQGLRLEDLADNNISPATISNIERGINHVNVHKIMYLLKK